MNEKYTKYLDRSCKYSIERLLGLEINRLAIGD